VLTAAEADFLGLYEPQPGRGGRHQAIGFEPIDDPGETLSAEDSAMLAALMDRSDLPRSDQLELLGG